MSKWVLIFLGEMALHLLPGKAAKWRKDSWNRSNEKFMNTKSKRGFKKIN